MAPDAVKDDGGDGAEPTLEGAFSSAGVDLTLIRWTLSLSPTERLQAAQDLIDTAADLSLDRET